MPQEQKRKLAAVMFTDIVGFSGKMAAQETATVELVNNYVVLIQNSIGARGGRLVKTIGDGTLSVFESAVDAVHFGVELLTQLDALNRTREKSKRLQIRIGLHLGDVMEQENGDVLGDAVNVAARLELAGPHNGMAISEEVYLAVKGKVNFPARDMGFKSFKNIDRSVRVYAIEPRAQWRFLAAFLLRAVAGLALLGAALLVFQKGFETSHPSKKAPTMGVFLIGFNDAVNPKIEPFLTQLAFELPKFAGPLRVLDRSEADLALASGRLDYALCAQVIQDRGMFLELTLRKTAGHRGLEGADPLKKLGKISLSQARSNPAVLSLLGELQLVLISQTGRK